MASLPRAAGREVAARAASQAIVAVAAVERVVAFAAVDQVGAGRAFEQVVRDAADQLSPACRGFSAAIAPAEVVAAATRPQQSSVRTRVRGVMPWESAAERDA